MDRRLKERLIGATILVVLIVLIVPELLSGPKRQSSAAKSAAASLDPATADPVRNVTVDLGTNKATPGTDDAPGAAASAAATTPDGAAVPAPDDESPDAGLDDAPSAGDTGTDEPVPPSALRKAPPTVTTLKAQRPAPGAVENEPAGTKKPANAGRATAPRETEVPEVSRHAWAVQVGSFANKPNAEKLVRHLHLQYPSVGLSASGSGASLRYRVRVGPLPDRNAAVQALGKLKAQKYQVSLVAPSP